jgi:hypothetical protein
MIGIEDVLDAKMASRSAMILSRVASTLDLDHSVPMPS